MPSNPQQIHAALRDIGSRIQQQSLERIAAEQEAVRLLRLAAAEPLRIRKLAESVARTSDPGLRCALPLNEMLDAGIGCTAMNTTCTLVAVDGSQVVPDRHEEVLFGLINVGIVTLHSNSGQAPDIDVDSLLLYGRDLHPDRGPLLSEGEIALRRDTRERASLLTHAKVATGISIALTDGPLELWGAKDVRDARAFEKALREYVGVLRELQRRGWIVAGYVDKPGADLIVRLLEISLAGPEDLKQLRNYHPLQEVSDRWLYAQILGAGERSAVFQMQSTSTPKYPGDLAVHFFYLNVGSDGHPWIVRIEIPKWVAEDPNRLDALHGVLLDQCAALGARPYPYILHRAHETARISDAEKEQIKLQLLMEMRQRGMEPEAQSAKSSAKARSDVKGSF